MTVQDAQAFYNAEKLLFRQDLAAAPKHFVGKLRAFSFLLEKDQGRALVFRLHQIHLFPRGVGDQMPAKGHDPGQQTGLILNSN